MRVRCPEKEEVRAVLDDMDGEGFDDLPDGAWWGIAAERLGVGPWEVQAMVGDDPEFYGWDVP